MRERSACAAKCPLVWVWEGAHEQPRSRPSWLCVCVCVCVCVCFEPAKMVCVGCLGRGLIANPGVYNSPDLSPVRERAFLKKPSPWDNPGS